VATSGTGTITLQSGYISQLGRCDRNDAAFSGGL
jgi:hypothetical protein